MLWHFLDNSSISPSLSPNNFYLSFGFGQRFYICLKTTSLSPSCEHTAELKQFFCGTAPLLCCEKVQFDLLYHFLGSCKIEKSFSYLRSSLASGANARLERRRAKGAKIKLRRFVFFGARFHI